MKYFEADDRCIECKSGRRPTSAPTHETFLFNNSPDVIRLSRNEDWQPQKSMLPLPLDKGPSRVAYVWTGDMHPDHIGDTVVMVHEGPLADILWVPCKALALDQYPGVWLWLCQPMKPKNPAEEDFMRSIST